MEPKKKPGCWSLRCVALVTGAIFLLAGIAFMGTFLYTTHELDALFEKLEQDGYATNRRDIAPSPIPLEESTTEQYRTALAPFEELRIPERFKGNPLTYETDITEISSWLKEHQKEIEAFLSVGDPRKYRFSWKYEDGYMMDTPEFSPITEASRILTLQAIACAREGDPRKAKEYLSAIIKLSVLLQSEPELIGQIIRGNILSNVIQGINDCITEKTSKEELKSWLQFVDELPPFEKAAEFGMRGELTHFAQLIQNPGSVDFLNEKAPISSQKWNPLTLHLKFDGIYGLNLFRRAIDLCKRPYLEVEQDMANITRELREAGRKKKYSLTCLVFPALRNIKRMEADVQCQKLIVRTGIFCELTRLEKGSYPKLIETVDPLTGESLNYSPEERWLKIRDEILLQENMHIWTLRQGK